MLATRLLLLVSLGINLFIAGWWVGARFDRPVLPPFARPFSLAEALTRELSPDGQDSVKPMIDRLDSIMRSGFSDRQSIFEALRSLATATSYDSARLHQLLASLPQQRTGSEVTQWQLVGDIFDKLSPADRVRFADVIFLRPGPPQGPDQQPPRGPMPFDARSAEGGQRQVAPQP